MIDAGAFRGSRRAGRRCRHGMRRGLPHVMARTRVFFSSRLILPRVASSASAQARQRVLAEKLFLPGTPEAPALPEKKMNVDGRIVKMRPWTVSGGGHEQKLIRSSSSFTHLEDGLSRIPLQPGNPGFPAPVKSRNPGEKAPPPRKNVTQPGQLPSLKTRMP